MASGQLASFRLPTSVQRYYESDFWSTYYFADATALATQTNVELFKTQIGAQGQGFPTSLSISETNMSEPGRIPSGLAFTTYQVALEPKYDNNYGVVRADMLNLAFYMVPQWSFLNTTVDIAPTALIGQGGGIFGATADTGAADGGSGGSRFIFNNGAGGTWVYHQLPVLLPANTTFSIKLLFGRSAAAVDGGPGNSNLLIRAHMLGVATSAVPEG